MSTDLWQIILVAVLGSAATAAAVNALTKRMELRAAAPTQAVERDSAARAADGGTIDRLSKENVRLSKRNDDLDAKLAQLEKRLDESDARADASEAREAVLVESMQRWIAWASQVREIASRHELELPPAPRSPLQDRM